MKALTFLFCLIATDLFAQVQPFRTTDENGFTWNYYRLNHAIRTLGGPIEKTRIIVTDISNGKSEKVASQFPGVYAHGDTVLENRVKWAARLISLNGLTLDSVYLGVGPEIYDQAKRKCRMLTFVYELPGSLSDKGYKNEIKVTFIQQADSFDLSFKGEFKLMTLIFTRASEQLELDRLRNAFR